MFKKNKNGEETVKVKAKIFKGKGKDKKESKPTVVDILNSGEVDFKDFRTYCVNYTENGDWVFNIGGEGGVMNTYDPEKKEIDSKEFAEAYDHDLIQVYRHQDDSLVTKNVKMLRCGEDGPYSSIVSICREAEKKLGKHNKKAELIANKICEFFDERMTDGDSIHNVHIWVPVWRTSSEKGFLVRLLDGRINFIVT